MTEYSLTGDRLQPHQADAHIISMKSHILKNAFLRKWSKNDFAKQELLAAVLGVFWTAQMASAFSVCHVGSPCRYYQHNNGTVGPQNGARQTLVQNRASRSCLGDFFFAASPETDHSLATMKTRPVFTKPHEQRVTKHSPTSDRSQPRQNQNAVCLCKTA